MNKKPKKLKKANRTVQGSDVQMNDFNEEELAEHRWSTVSAIAHARTQSLCKCNGEVHTSWAGWIVDCVYTVDLPAHWADSNQPNKLIRQANFPQFLQITFRIINWTIIQLL